MHGLIQNAERLEVWMSLEDLGFVDVLVVARAGPKANSTDLVLEAMCRARYALMFCQSAVGLPDELRSSRPTERKEKELGAYNFPPGSRRS